MAERKQYNNKRERVEREYDQKMVDLARVTRVMAGGKRMSFRACVVIGNKNGKIGYGVAKGPDVQSSIGKAVRLAERDMIYVKLTKDGSVPHIVNAKFKSAQVLIKPAPLGTGVKAGGAVRIVLDMAGVKNVVAKQLGAKNKVNNVKAVFEALYLFAGKPESKDNNKKVKKEDKKSE